MRGWRNRQTRWIQVPVPARAWGFNSPLAHHRNRAAPYRCRPIRVSGTDGPTVSTRARAGATRRVRALGGVGALGGAPRTLLGRPWTVGMRGRPACVGACRVRKLSGATLLDRQVSVTSRPTGGGRPSVARAPARSGAPGLSPLASFLLLSWAGTADASPYYWGTALLGALRDRGLRDHRGVPLSWNAQVSRDAQGTAPQACPLRGRRVRPGGVTRGRGAGPGVGGAVRRRRAGRGVRRVECAVRRSAGGAPASGWGRSGGRPGSGSRAEARTGVRRPGGGPGGRPSPGPRGGPAHERPRRAGSARPSAGCAVPASAPGR